MLDDLGEGIFDSVKLGVEKKAKERVAIKIIKKKKRQTKWHWNSENWNWYYEIISSSKCRTFKRKI